MPRLARLRAVAVVALLVVPVLACEPKGSVAGPGDVKAAQAKGTLLRYQATARAVKTQTKIHFRLAGGGQQGEIKSALAATLAFSDGGSGKVNVTYRVDAVDSLDLGGMMQSKPKEGVTPPPDPKQKLLEAKGGWVMDLRGQVDDAATKSMPENAKPDPSKAGDKAQPDTGSMMKELLAGMLRLPELPEQGLELGKPLKVEKQEQQQLSEGIPKMPIESETTYTLVSVKQEGGKDLAEVKVEAEASGATELQQGAMLTVDTTTAGTMVFDLTSGVPIRANWQVTQNFAFGDQSQEISTQIESTYTPG